MIQAFGYANEDETLLRLEEVSIQCNIDELDKIIEFLQMVKNQHEKVIDSTEMCHSHFRDWSNEWCESSSDIIIVTTP